MRGIATQADVAAIEARGLPADLPGSTYEAIRRTALAHPEAPALSFFLRAVDYAKPETWNYRQLLAKIRQYLP